MEIFEHLIKELNTLVDTAESIQDIYERNDFIEENSRYFWNIFSEDKFIFTKYAFKEPNNPAQNELSEMFNRNIIRLLKLQTTISQELSIQNDTLSRFNGSILGYLALAEQQYTYRHLPNISYFENAFEHLNYRNEILSILHENNLFDNVLLTRQYVNNNYETDIFMRALAYIADNFHTLSKETASKLISDIDKFSNIEKLLTTKEICLHIQEKILVSQYCNTILKLKSIFAPEQLKHDKILNLLWNGNITNMDSVFALSKVITIDTWKDLLQYDADKSDYGFFIELANHFKSVNLSEYNISYIISPLLKHSSIFDTAQLLANTAFDNSQNDNLNWLNNRTLAEKLQVAHKDISSARYPFLPAEYYIKALENFDEFTNVSPNFIGNLYTLLHSDYYTDEEKATLKNSLEKAGLYDEVAFEQSAQIIPLDTSKSILNGHLSDGNPIDKLTLQYCIKSIASNLLKEDGIDIQGKVFFGSCNAIEGEYSLTQNSIWINDCLLDMFLSSSEPSKKAHLIVTIFHEMHHAKQENFIKQKNFDFTTYNFLKELIIDQYDENFYESPENYLSIFIESDARKESLLSTLEFFKSLNPDFFEEIKSDFEEEFIDENENYSIGKNPRKKSSVMVNSEIDISEYLGILIKTSTNILTEYPILSLEYESDGSIKSLETLLQEFEEKRVSAETSIDPNIISIYQGLITRALAEREIDDDILQKKIDDFLEFTGSLVSMEDMKSYYLTSIGPSTNSFYSRLYNLTQQTEEKGVEYDDSRG